MANNKNTNPIRLPAPGGSRSTAKGPSAGSQGHYDAVPLNPAGQEAVDYSTHGPLANLLRCKAKINIATMNTRTIREQKGQLELAENMKKTNIAIIGIQEHRIVHADAAQKVMHHRIGDYYLATASAWRNAAQAATGGVGIAMSQAAKKALISVTAHSERIILANFQSNPVTTIISTYAPTSAASDEARQEFYSSLSAAVSSVPAHNFLTILGDFNCRLGADVTQHSFHEETNQGGKMLCDLMQEHALIACNTLFRKKKNKLWTWHSPPDAQQKVHKQQIDFILVRRKWRNSIHDAQAYNSFASIGSDHRVVTAKIQLSLRAPKKKSIKRTKYIWKALENNVELQERYFN